MILAAAGVAAGALVPARESRAASFSGEQRDRLDRGEVVTVRLDVDLDQGAYFGGTSYVVVNAPVADVAAIVDDPGAYTSILPKTLESRVLGPAAPRGGDRRVYFRQGGRAASAAYVLFVRRESVGLFRFWLDPSAPHDIADLWGYFDVQPFEGSPARSMVSYAALLRLDFGVVRMLFSETIRRFAMSTPGLLRAYVEERHGHGR